MNLGLFLKRHVPNTITLLRIALTLVLMFLPLLSPAFLLVYLLAGTGRKAQGRRNHQRAIRPVALSIS